MLLAYCRTLVVVEQDQISINAGFLASLLNISPLQENESESSASDDEGPGLVYLEGQALLPADATSYTMVSNWCGCLH